MSSTPSPLRRFVGPNETDDQALPGQVNHWYFKDGLGDSENLVFVRAVIQPGSGHPFHSHPEMDEMIYVLRGEMEQWLEKEKRIMRPGDCLYIPRGVVHGCYKDGEGECEFLAILTPTKIQGPFSRDYSKEESWCSLRS